MKKILLICSLSALLCSCGGKDYDYADAMLDFYEELIDRYNDADRLEDLNALFTKAQQEQKEITRQQQQSFDEMVADIEKYDEDAYLLHLRILTAESHAQWTYYKRKKELEPQH